MHHLVSALRVGDESIECASNGLNWKAAFAPPRDRPCAPINASSSPLATWTGRTSQMRRILSTYRLMQIGCLENCSSSFNASFAHQLNANELLQLPTASLHLSAVRRQSTATYLQGCASGQAIPQAGHEDRGYIVLLVARFDLLERAEDGSFALTSRPNGQRNCVRRT